MAIYQRLRQLGLTGEEMFWLSWFFNLEVIAILDKLTKEMFSKYLRETYHIKFGSSSIVYLELIQAISLTATPSQTWQDQSNQESKREPFSIMFRGPQELALPQGIYDVKHDRMGVIKGLFLVPVGIDERGRYYEAIFN